MLKKTKKMGRSLLLMLSFVLCSASNAMSQSETSLTDSIIDVFDMDKASVFPSFPGGDKKLVEFIENELRFPRQSIQNKVSGRVSVRFVINKDGSIINPEILRSLDPYCDKEAIRVIKLMPKWDPGKDKNGNLAAFYFTLPIIFKLTY